MEINLEKIELVKERTGATYAESKEALEKANGSVVDAIIDIEENINMNKDAKSSEESKFKDNPTFKKMKEIIEKGNVSRIIIAKNGETYVNFPLTAGVVGAILVPWGVILGIVAALGTQCDIQFVDDKNQVVDINGKVISAYDKAKGTTMKGINKVQDKVQDIVDKIDKDGETLDKLGDYANKATDKIKDLVDEGVAAFNKTVEKVNEDGKIDAIKESVEKAAKEAFEAFKNAAKQAADKVEDIGESMEDKIEDLEEKIEKKAEDIGIDVEIDDKEE
ncbi:MAG TPA: DUF4342 domain-containing protein [Mogibacterium sp.]|nr:DUF4342 domain-containing protein [Mogibacterium sp.]